MFSPAAIGERLQKKALEPFRIHISDGTKCDVVHPEFVLVVLTRVEILVPWKEKPVPPYFGAR